MKNNLFIILFTTYGIWFVLLNTKYFNNNYNILLILAFGFAIGTLFLKRRKQILTVTTTTTYNQANPFLKIGDIIYLHSLQGKYRVVSIDDAGFSVVPEQKKTDVKSIHCLWDDLKRWSSRS